MKKIAVIGMIAATGIAFTSCDSLLDDNREQLTVIENTQLYWNNYDNCILQVDRYQDEINSGYGSGGSLGQFYGSTRSDDQVGASFVNWTHTVVPATSEWSYSQVRGANTIINGVKNSTLVLSQKRNIWGIARLIRAAAYFSMVKYYGNCVWENEVVDPGDKEAMFAAPISRDVVMDSVLADLDFAIANIQTESNKIAWSKDLARAMKSEVCLYEGTFCKYRTQADNGMAPDAARANKYLTECANVSKELMDKYGFEEGIDGYHSIYNSVWGGKNSAPGALGDITDFTKIKEIIFGRRYDATNLRHSTIARTASSTTTAGMSLDAFESYLFLDGKPKSKTTYNTSIVGENGTMTINGKEVKVYKIDKVLANRDKRLTIATDPCVYYKGMEWSRAGTTGLNSSSGFGVAKYDNLNLSVISRGNDANNFTSAPIYWTSYIMCNYIEAKAELGSISDADLDLTYNKMMDRAGLPHQTVASLTAMNDPANNMGVSSLIWEIRRNRRCELMFDGFRYFDLIRWHQLELLDSEKHPNIMRGAYVGNADIKPATIDAEGYVRPYMGTNRIYDPKYYLYPHSSGQMALYQQQGYTLPQNPGW